MTGIYGIRNLPGVRFAALFAISTISVWGQCAMTYQDSASSDTSIYAWVTLTDNYTSPYTGCAPGWGNFTHSYTASVTLYAASGRVAYGYGGGQQSGDAGTGGSSAEAFLDILNDDDFGNFSFSGSDSIFCSVAGNVFSDSVSGSGFAPTPSRKNYPQSPFGNLGCLVRDGFDTLRGSGKHRAQDVKYPGVTVGTQVQSMEAGTVVGVFTGRPHADNNSSACQTGGAGHPQPNAVGIQGADGHVTWYRHVSASVTRDTQVAQGQVIGTLDDSGCWTGPHTHIDRRVSLASAVAENFHIPNCPGSGPEATQYIDDQLDDETIENLSDY